MIAVRPFQPDDLLRAGLNRDGLPDDRETLIVHGARVAAAGPCVTGEHRGRVIACGGAIMAHDNHASLWCVMAPVRGRLLRAVTEEVAAFIAGLSARRIDMMVRDGFAAGHHWAARLGFVAEGHYGDFLPDGGGVTIYRHIPTGDR